MGYRPRDFKLEELVPPDIHSARGERAWELLDTYALLTLQTLRDKLGPITVNNWHVGGQYRESGLRSLITKTGATLSQHRFGRAFDCKLKSHAPREAADYILAHQAEFPYLTVLENPDATPTWLHFDTRNSNREGIWIVNP